MNRRSFDNNAATDIDTATDVLYTFHLDRHDKSS